VSFTFNPLTGEFDITGTGGGGPVVQNPNYVKTFVIADFVGPSAGSYTFTVLSSTHGKGLNPIVQVLEQVGLEYESVILAYKINASGDVTIFVSDVPDLRFDGKLILSENN
jgi:hypothetical protein